MSKPKANRLSTRTRRTITPTAHHRKQTKPTRLTHRGRINQPIVQTKMAVRTKERKKTRTFRLIGGMKENRNGKKDLINRSKDTFPRLPNSERRLTANSLRFRNLQAIMPTMFPRGLEVTSPIGENTQHTHSNSCKLP